MSRVVVVGGTGAMGQAVTDVLGRRGHDVTVASQTAPREQRSPGRAWRPVRRTRR
jgi:predicted dinucleotide-binding enzyme